MLTRQYAPGLGRFTTRDLLFGEPPDPLSLNQYVYTEGNPVSNIDPSGMVKTGIGGGCSGECSRTKRQNEHRHGKGQSSDSGLTPLAAEVVYSPAPARPVPVQPQVAFVPEAKPASWATQKPDPVSLALGECSRHNPDPRARFGCAAAGVAYRAAKWWVASVPPQIPYDESKDQFNPSSPDGKFFCHHPGLSRFSYVGGPGNEHPCVPTAPRETG